MEVFVRLLFPFAVINGGPNMPTESKSSINCMFPKAAVPRLDRTIQSSLHNKNVHITFHSEAFYVLFWTERIAQTLFYGVKLP